MKKKMLTSLALAAAMLSCCIPASSAAAADDGRTVSVVTEYLDDDSCIVITTVQDENNARAYKTSGYKTYEYRENGTTMWSYKLSASFNYMPSISASCTSASDSYSIDNNKWSLVSHSCSYSADTAYGTITMKKGSSTHTASIQLTCDSYGNIS